MVTLLINRFSIYEIECVQLTIKVEMIERIYTPQNKYNNTDGYIMDPKTAVECVTRHTHKVQGAQV